MGIVLDTRLAFEIHVDQKIKKWINWSHKKTLVNVSRKALHTSYKSFIRSHLDYGDILYDKPENKSFLNKLGKFKYKAFVVITGAIQGTSKQKLYSELGLHSQVKGIRVAN